VLTIQGKDGKTTFSVMAATMIYELSERNLEIFTKEDKLEQIVQDANSYRDQMSKLTQEEITKLLKQKDRKTPTLGLGYRELIDYQNAFLKGEEQRRTAYGPPVRLEVGQRVMVVLSTKGDDTLGVFVLQQNVFSNKK
jgi:hypothetical protein